MMMKATAATAICLLCASAFADEEGFHGYVRAGEGISSTHGPQSCFGLGGNTMKYRLGNECDAYAEFGYTKEMVKMPTGASFLATVWTDVFTPRSDFGGSKLEIAKAFVEVRGLNFLRGGTVWVGKRFYFRPEIHMLDLQYINLNGTGAGIDQFPAGPGKFGYAFFKDNDATANDPVTHAVTTTAAVRQNFIYQDVAVNSNGTVDAALSVITAQAKEGHNGWQLSVFHKQSKVYGGVNTVGIQYGVGPGTGIGVGNDRIGASGNTMLGSDVTRLRVFDEIWIQPQPHFGMEFVALAQRDQSGAHGSSTWTTLGVRPVYALTENIKLTFELGTDRVTSPDSGPAQRLTKFTFAPSISAGPGLWSRPELRAFISFGKWNSTATAAVNASNNSGPVYGDRTSGASFGFQFENWF